MGWKGNVSEVRWAWVIQALEKKYRPAAYYLKALKEKTHYVWSI